MLNAIGLAISLMCLFISHYVLDLTSALADNISANVIGLVLGTTFRFWSYSDVRVQAAARGTGRIRSVGSREIASDRVT